MLRKIALIAVVAMIALAGCSGAGPGATDSTPAPDDGSADSDGETAGTVAFFVSDDPNDIDDFAHLNVTVEEVQFHYVPGSNNSSSAGSNVTNATVTTTAANTTNGTTPNASTPAEEPGEGQARWITRDGNGTVIDLTELQGANASLLQNYSVPAGKYTQVRLKIGEINATLTDGSDQRVKLPSERLKLNKPFELAANDTVEFVFDITVKEAGKSGKYILKPVAGESGPDQQIDRVD